MRKILLIAIVLICNNVKAQDTLTFGKVSGFFITSAGLYSSSVKVDSGDFSWFDKSMSIYLYEDSAQLHIRGIDTVSAIIRMAHEYRLLQEQKQMIEWLVSGLNYDFILSEKSGFGDYKWRKEMRKYYRRWKQLENRKEPLTFKELTAIK